MSKKILKFLVAIAMLQAPALAVAQQYPAKPIRIIVPFPAGGNIGAEIVAKSPPDGYTLVTGSIGTHAKVVKDAGIRVD